MATRHAFAPGIGRPEPMYTLLGPRGWFRLSVALANLVAVLAFALYAGVHHRDYRLGLLRGRYTSLCQNIQSSTAMHPEDQRLSGVYSVWCVGDPEETD